MGMAKKAAGIKRRSAVRTTVLRVLALFLAGFGVYAFRKNQIADYLFLKSQFVFFDFSQPSAQFFVEYLAMMGLFAAASYYLGRALQKSKKKEESP